MPDTPAVAVLSPNAKVGLIRGKPLARVPLDTCFWPLGCPDRLTGKRIGDLGPEDHLVSFGRTLSPIRPAPGVRAKVSVALAEPTVIQGAHHARVIRNAARFHRVLSYRPDVLDRVPNGIFFPYGSTWIPDWKDCDTTKSKLCSLIASAKRSQPGHVLRHQVADWAQTAKLDVDLLGQGYAPFGAKSDGLAPYRYSVVIENAQEVNYFTEKLIDAVLCETVPIYWGCPNLGDFIDTSGMILCQSFEDMQAALQSMSEDDYAARLPALRRAVPQADSYADYFARAARAVLEDRPVP
ncbi:MAG: glycosyltransferase family 10 [Pseudomonadota bacterium]